MMVDHMDICSQDSTPGPEELPDLACLNLTQLDHYIPRNFGPKIECCCGQSSCAFGKHSNTALYGMQKDVLTAARLGQVCKTYSWSLPYLGCTFLW